MSWAWIWNIIFLFEKIVFVRQLYFVSFQCNTCKYFVFCISWQHIKVFCISWQHIKVFYISNTKINVIIWITKNLQFFDFKYKIHNIFYVFHWNTKYKIYLYCKNCTLNKNISNTYPTLTANNNYLFQIFRKFIYLQIYHKFITVIKFIQNIFWNLVSLILESKLLN